MADTAGPRIRFAEPAPNVFVGYTSRCPSPQEEVAKLRRQVACLRLQVQGLQDAFEVALAGCAMYAASVATVTRSHTCVLPQDVEGMPASPPACMSARDPGEVAP